jgi:DNA helicase-2/ATP-dependent DNA helicase PcrA
LARPQTKEHVPTANFVASETADLQEGLRIEHQKFGFGKIAKLEGASHNPIATILFDINGEKKIMLNYAKLRIVEN